MRNTLLLLSALLLAPLGALHAAEKAAVVFYVATGGADINPGSYEQPFATLERARDAIRELKKNSNGLPAGGVTVSLRGGIYPRTTSFVLGPEDSGTPDAPVVYTVGPVDRPQLVGGIVVDTGLFKNPNGQEAERFKKAYTANKSLPWWVIRTLDLNAIPNLPKDVPGTIPNYGVASRSDPLPSESELFVNGQCMVLARWPNNAELFVQALDISRTKSWEPPYDVWVKGSDKQVWSGVTRNVVFPIDMGALPDKGF